MRTHQIEVQRLSLTCSRPFDSVVAALEAALGHPDMAELSRAVQSAPTLAELERVVARGLGRTGLMLFMKLDQGAVLRKETGRFAGR